jgi:hypothetical protein
MPVRHSIEQVQEFVEYIKSITTIESNQRSTYFTLKAQLTQHRAKQIRRWIENEQVMCALDAGYFEDRYAWVIDHRGEIYKFRNRKAQQVYDNIIADAEEDQRAIQLLILKARQLGVTTKTALRFVQRILFVPNTQAVMGSVIQDKSELIQRIIETCIERLPWWLVPQRSKDTKKLIGFNNGSVMSIQSGTQATGIAQGWTPSCVHLSEIGDIPNPKKTIEEGLLPATHQSSKLFLVFEGTGNGNTGWQADTWKNSKEQWHLGNARLQPVFIPWPMAPDLYPEPDWLREHPVPGGFKPLEVTRKHIQRCELYIRNTDYLAKVCGKDYRMPVPQQWFWQWNYLQKAATHTQKIWLSQMPADDYEALQGKNDLVFDPITIDSAQQERERKYQCYAIQGDSIDDGFEPDPDEIDYDKERIRVTWNSHRGQRFAWTMIPLKEFDDREEKRSHDRVLVFEPPNMMPGSEGDPQDYSIGIDTADGLGNEDEDRSVMSVTRSMKGEQRDVQVAELCSNRINAPQMVGFAACIAAWYGDNTIDPRGVKFAIEQRERPGDDCQLQLKLMGFTFHHIDRRYDNKKIANAVHANQKEGIFMHGWFRPMLMARFVEAINNGWYMPNSPFLIAELKDLERKVTNRGKSRLEHQSGKHDDRVLAAAHSYWTRHELDNMAERAQKRYAPPTTKLPELEQECATVSLSRYLSDKMTEGWA